MNFWKNKKVLVTGGAGFIGSYLSEFLVAEGADLTITDSLVRGSKDNIKNILKKAKLKTLDLLIIKIASKLVKDNQSF